MYGPPGCGKTHLARATAGEIKAGFLAVGIHDVLDMWIGNSEKQLHGIFEQARRSAPCVLFFDEVDALGASRTDMRTSGGRHLINQFLSPLANHRTDAYGGSRDNRMRFALEVVDAVRAAWPAHKPLFVRISATDAAEGGWDIEDSIVLAGALRTRGVNAVHVSSGGVSSYGLKAALRARLYGLKD